MDVELEMKGRKELLKLWMNKKPRKEKKKAISFALLAKIDFEVKIIFKHNCNLQHHESNAG